MSNLVHSFDELSRIIVYILLVIVAVCISLLILSLLDRVTLYGSVTDDQGNFLGGITVVAYLDGTEVGRATSSSYDRTTDWNFAIELQGNYGLPNQVPGASIDIPLGDLPIGKTKNLYLDGGQVLLQVIAVNNVAMLPQSENFSNTTPDATSKNWAVLLFGQIIAACSGLLGGVVADMINVRGKRSALIIITIYLVTTIMSIIVSVSYVK